MVLLAVFACYVGPFEGYVGPFRSYVGTMLASLGLSWRLRGALLGHLKALLRLCSATRGTVGGFCVLCWAF